MRQLTSREVEIVKGNRKNPKPILDLPDGAFPLVEEDENWIILLPANVRDGLMKTIGRMLASISKITPIDLRIMGELRDAQNLYFVQKGDYYQREITDVNELLSYLQVGYTLGDEPLSDITPPKAATCVALLKYSLDIPQHGFEWMEYEARFNDYYVDYKKETDLTTTDAKILKAWLRVLGQYSSTFVPSSLLAIKPPTVTVEDPDPKYANTPSPYKYNVGASIEKQKVRDIIIEVARSKSYPENRLLAQIWHESRYDPKALNKSSGAAGLGQFLKGTGAEQGLNPYPDGFYDPYKNAGATIAYMSKIMGRMTKWGAKNEEESWKGALAGYYEGDGYIIRDLIRSGFCTGSGMKFNSNVRKWSWSDIEPQLSGPHSSYAKTYVSSISNGAQNPP